LIDGGSARRQFEPASEVDFTFYLRLDPWWGSTRAHLIQLLTTADGLYKGPGSTHCTCYVDIEFDGLLLVIQDYQATYGGTYRDTNPGWRSNQIPLDDGNWHKIRVYFKTNTWSVGGPNADGVMRAWIDDQLVIEDTAVAIFRHDPNQKFNQLLLAPYTPADNSPERDTSLYVDGIRFDEPVSGTSDSADGVGAKSPEGSRYSRSHEPPAGMTWFWVDGTNGRNSNDGTTEATAWETLPHALSKLQPGQGLNVMEGSVYEVTSDDGFDNAALQPSASGTPDNPIIIRARPGFVTKPIIRRTAGSGPLIGARGKDHIWWMNLEIDGARLTTKVVAFYDSHYCKLIRCTAHGAYEDTLDNCNVVRLEACAYTVVYGNDLYDSHNAQETTNASCITMYSCANCIISHNDLKDAVAGIKDKSEGQPIDKEYMPIPDEQGSFGNLIECNRFQSTLDTGVVLAVQNGQDITNCTIRNNQFACTGRGLDGGYQQYTYQDGVYGLKVYNNTFTNYGSSAIRVPVYGDYIEIYNNHFHGTSSTVPDIEGYNYVGVTKLGYNAFRYSAYIWRNDKQVKVVPDPTDIESAPADWVDSTAGIDDYRLRSGTILLEGGERRGYIGAFPREGKAVWAWWLQPVRGRFDASYDPPAGMTWYWVDAVSGRDVYPGTEAEPWQTIEYAAAQLNAPGQGLNVIPSGIYYANGDGGSTSYWMPAVQPSGSGTPTRPIVIRKAPGYIETPIIRRTSTKSHYTVGAVALSDYGSRDYIWYIDLDIEIQVPIGSTSSSPAAFHYTVGSRLIRCKLHGSRAKDHTDNVSGIRLEHTDFCHVYGCEMYDIWSVDSNSQSHNQSGLKLYSTRNLIAHFNEVYDTYCAFIDKTAVTSDPRMTESVMGSEENEISYNYFHDITEGIANLSRGGDYRKCREEYYHNNLVDIGSGTAFDARHDLNGDHPSPGIYYYNNTIVGYTRQGIDVIEVGTDTRIYNNIFVPGSDPAVTDGLYDVYTRGDPASISRLDHNCYRYSPSIYTRAGTLANGADTLTETDPLFIDPSTADYRLQQGSPCKGADSDGNDMGCFDINWKWW
jgi:hypothetical protein